MLMDQYFSAMKDVLASVEQTQRDTIVAAAAAIADRLARGGAWHIMDTGHMLMFEGVGRTGGMMALKPIRITCEIQNPVRYRPSPARGGQGYDSIPGFADFVLGRANILPDDVVMIGSVSGYNYFPVDLALKANELGCLTVAITSVQYSSRLKSRHPSGKRLFEACTFCLDNCTNYGDTLVDVPGARAAHLPGERRQRQLSDVGAAEHGRGAAALRAGSSPACTSPTTCRTRRASTARRSPTMNNTAIEAAAWN